MAATGSGLYTAVKPILEEGCTDLMEFRTKMGAKISKYVAENAELVGAYAGATSHGSPVYAAAAGKLVPTDPLPPLLADPMPFSNYQTWIKKTIENDVADPQKGTILWNITAVAPFVNTPVILDPTVSFLDLFGDFSDIRTSYGFWALICDAVICCINGYIPISTPATTAGSSGTILWAPEETPELKHNFIFRVTYDPNNARLVQWIDDHLVYSGSLAGDVDIPIDDKSYTDALELWKELSPLTEQCTFYKKQDDGELILLTTGAAF